VARAPAPPSQETAPGAGRGDPSAPRTSRPLGDTRLWAIPVSLPRIPEAQDWYAAGGTPPTVGPARLGVRRSTDPLSPIPILKSPRKVPPPVGLGFRVDTSPWPESYSPGNDPLARHINKLVPFPWPVGREPFRGAPPSGCGLPFIAYSRMPGRFTAWLALSCGATAPGCSPRASLQPLTPSGVETPNDGPLTSFGIGTIWPLVHDRPSRTAEPSSTPGFERTWFCKTTLGFLEFLP